LRGDANPITESANASLHHVVNPELPRDLLHIDGTSKLEGGIASNDEQRPKPRQLGNDVLGDPVAKILLLGIADHIRQR
jgi:hypothetical protein